LQCSAPSFVWKLSPDVGIKNGWVGDLVPGRWGIWEAASWVGLRRCELWSQTRRRSYTCCSIQRPAPSQDWPRRLVRTCHNGQTTPLHDDTRGHIWVWPLFSKHMTVHFWIVQANLLHNNENKKAQLSLTNPRDAKVCQKLFQFDVLTTLSLIRLAVVASVICEIPRNSLKIQTYGVQGHPRSSILVSMESPYVTSY